MKKQKTEAKINLEALAGGAFAEKLNEALMQVADKLKEAQGVALLCTECAVKAGFLSPYQNKPNPAGNRAQRRRANRERKK